MSGTYIDNRVAGSGGAINFSGIKIISDEAIRELTKINVEINDNKPDLNIYVPEIKVPEIIIPEIKVPECKVTVEPVQIAVSSPVNNIHVEQPKLEIKFHVKHVYIALLIQTILLGTMLWVLTMISSR